MDIDQAFDREAEAIKDMLSHDQIDQAEYNHRMGELENDRLAEEEFLQEERDQARDLGIFGF